MKVGSELRFVVFILAACGGANEPSGYIVVTPTPTSASTPSASVAEKAIDIPDLAGKRESEIMGVLGQPAVSSKLTDDDTSGETRSDWALDAGKLYIHFKDGRANYFHFICECDRPTAAELGDVVGMDLRPMQSVASTKAETTFAGIISGKEFKEVRALVNGKFFVITARVD
ncbi:hypothetical protein BH24ACI3_BH24ACI3_13600 [soil metagenome]